jgi:drug/metabolite transporter (DMT)-like permease
MRSGIALWTVYLVWGSTYLAIRYVVETMPALLSAAGAVLPGRRAVRGLARRAARAVRAAGHARGGVGCAIVGVALLLGGNGLVSVGEDQGVPVGARRARHRVDPAVGRAVPAAGRRARRARDAAVGSRSGFAGVAVLLLPGDRPDDAPLGGMLILVAAAFCWASGSFASARLSIPDDPIRATALQMLIGGGVMASSGSRRRGRPGRRRAFSAESIAALAYLVVFGSLCAFTAYAWLLKHAPISQVATYAYVNPVVAIALGALFVHEEVTALMAVAAVIICASVAGTIREEAPKRPPAVAEEPAVA